MKLEIVRYGHPALRKKGAQVEKFDAQLAALIENMQETMYDAAGIGLAAQQVGEPVQVTVIDIRGVTDRPSTLKWEGQDVSPDDHMPMVLINPEIKPLNDPVAGPEGCLSFPEIYADVSRPESVEVTALNQHGERIQFQCGGLLARAVQHETDHLNGILFIDRMTAETKQKLRPELDELQEETKASLKK